MPSMRRPAEAMGPLIDRSVDAQIQRRLLAAVREGGDKEDAAVAAALTAARASGGPLAAASIRVHLFAQPMAMESMLVPACR